MDKQGNCQGHLWLLTGTGDGPPLAEALLDKGWKVTVSVVSQKASRPYVNLPLEKILIGSLENDKAVRRVIENARLDHNGFDWVIDLTHPFALLITSTLKTVCKELAQPFIRYERPIEDLYKAKILKNISDLSNYDLNGKSLLIALGTRKLPEAVHFATLKGANVYARILPTVDSFQKALSTSICEKNIALLNPSRDISSKLEESLCKKWSIDIVLCRQSGGATERMWQKVCNRFGIELFMISRPPSPNDIEISYTFDEIYMRIDTIK